MSKKPLGFCQCGKLSEHTEGSPGTIGWFEQLLMRVLPHFDIIKTVPEGGRNGHDENGEPRPRQPLTVLYLRRFFLFRSKWFGKNWGNIYLHKIYRSDDDPDPHDHPWNFRTFVLAGAYFDQSYMFTDLDGNGNGYRSYLANHTEFIKAPATRYRGRKHTHRVILYRCKPAWTLVLTGPEYETAAGAADWNFVTEDRIVPWREYLKLDKGDDYGD